VTCSSPSAIAPTISQACVWPMFRDLLGPKNLFERLD